MSILNLKGEFKFKFLTCLHQNRIIYNGSSWIRKPWTSHPQHCVPSHLHVRAESIRWPFKPWPAKHTAKNHRKCTTNCAILLNNLCDHYTDQ
ncbi:hypothetical protein M8J76_007716 [Diaphorina citri]|nr:hypothetical protein M8J76_007716 [Diaphorina citri]